jgi:hypothetical protein
VTEGAREQDQKVDGMASACLVLVCTLFGADCAKRHLLLGLNRSHSENHMYDYWLDNTLGAKIFAPVGASLGVLTMEPIRAEFTLAGPPRAPPYPPKGPKTTYG